MTTEPMLLDLFCGGGGAAAGYHQAGFKVVGVDLHPMPHYPFEFCQADALDLLRHLPMRRFAAIHASPPCQRYSVTRNMHANEYPDLISPLRELLLEIGLPYVIENVPQAPLQDPVILCGSQFGIFQHWKGDHWEGEVYLQRHRAFETSFPVPDAGPHDHTQRAVTVAGHGRMGGNENWFRGRGYSKLKRDIMGIDWMRENELNEAIPPAYAQYVGKFLMEACANQPA